MKTKTMNALKAIAVLTSHFNCVGLICAALSLTAEGARALTLVEDFEFYTTDTLALNAGGERVPRRLGRWRRTPRI
jgi:hypothetical protein